MTSSPIHPDDLASEIAAHEPYSYYATADAEEHYLFSAGHIPSCGCSRCWIAAEQEDAEENARWEAEQYAAQVDALSDDELEELMFASWYYVEQGWRSEFRTAVPSWVDCPF